MSARRRRRAGRAQGRGARRLAALRFPGIEPDRGARGGHRPAAAGIWPPAGGSTSCRRPGSPGGWFTPSSGTTSTTCPAPRRVYAGRIATGRRAEVAARRDEPCGDGVLTRQRHPVRVPRRCRHRRDGARGRRRRGDAAATSSSASTDSGTPPRSRRTARPLRSSIASRTRAFEAVTRRLRDGHGDDGVRHPAADGAVVRGRRAWSRDPRRTCRRRRTRAIRTTCRRRTGIARFGATSCCCSICGESCGRPGRRLCRHHLGRLHRPPRCRTG